MPGSCGPAVQPRLEAVTTGARWVRRREGRGEEGGGGRRCGGAGGPSPPLRLAAGPGPEALPGQQPASACSTWSSGLDAPEQLRSSLCPDLPWSLPPGAEHPLLRGPEGRSPGLRSEGTSGALLPHPASSLYRRGHIIRSALSSLPMQTSSLFWPTSSGPLFWGVSPEDSCPRWPLLGFS